MCLYHKHTHTASGTGKTFSASRRQKLPEFLIIDVVFFSSSSHHPLSDPAHPFWSRTAIASVSNLFFLASIPLNRILRNIEKWLIMSWGKKFSSVSYQLNWLLAWQRKFLPKTDELPENENFPQQNALLKKKNNGHAIGLDSKNFVYTFARCE